MSGAHRSHVVLSLALFAAAVGTACKPSESANNRPDSTRAAARTDSSAMRHDTTTDGDIAMMVSMANANDSSGGAYARQHAVSPAVRDFAARMVREHGAANREASALARRLNPASSPHENDDVRKMRDDAEHSMMTLQRDSGAAFDKNYMDHEVDGHQHVLDKIDHDFIPHATDADLKRMLTQARTMVNTHLQDAKRIRDGLHS
jgi:putative membrane protein